MKATLTYSDNAFATIETSGTTELGNTARIIGTKGEIIVSKFNDNVKCIHLKFKRIRLPQLENFWSPTTLTDIDGHKKTWPLPEGKHKYNFTNSSGLRYEAEEVRQCIRNGLVQSAIVSHNESLIIANIEDEIRKQIGVVYPADG